MLLKHIAVPLRLIILLALLWIDRCIAIKWLALYQSKQRQWTSNQNCSKSLGLVKRQNKICKHHLDLMGTVSHAAYLSVDTCQQQFGDRRWNCSSVKSAPRLTRDLVRGHVAFLVGNNKSPNHIVAGDDVKEHLQHLEYKNTLPRKAINLRTREQAFLHSISSAALVHSIARACSIGVTTKCSCGALPNQPPSRDFKWGGCGDDVKFGMYFSEAFTDASLSKKGKIKSSKRAQMNRHNNAVGRKILSDSLSIACKCHGVSGSCSIKTCWKSLPDFSVIGQTLKHKYSSAVEVKRRKRKGQKIFIPANPKIQTVTKECLLYYTKSPDYCEADRKTGSIGTRGRFCDKDSAGWGGCDIMCCGRGYKSFTMEIVERCECKYYWCCYVKCKTCKKTLDLNMCR